jgi:hypothetical protein
VQKKEMVPLKDFLKSKESIYKTSWLPSPWKVLQWGLRQVGVIGQPQSPEKLSAGSFRCGRDLEEDEGGYFDRGPSALEVGLLEAFLHYSQS